MLFLPSGLGNIGASPWVCYAPLVLFTCSVGAPIGGRLSDAVVRRAKEKSNRVWVPEERLRAAWLAGLVLVPMSVTLSGFTTAYVDGALGLVINLVCLFNDGAGVSNIPDIICH
jgi:MFS family permease